MNICVIGLGKIGLPLAVHFAKMGNSVIGADINEVTVNQVNAGQEPFPEEENLQEAGCTCEDVRAAAEASGEGLHRTQRSGV